MGQDLASLVEPHVARLGAQRNPERARCSAELERSAEPALHAVRGAPGSAVLPRAYSDLERHDQREALRDHSPGAPAFHVPGSRGIPDDGEAIEGTTGDLGLALD